MWAQDEQGLHRQFQFKNFVQAWAFMNEVAKLAELHDHHPDWSNSYNKVDITLISHDKKQVTERDFRLADAID
ncbi:MAG: 4a-hydroxytetrahydrobiopterin dehydratase, partial [Actinobacteria bacterium]|nr:4a-hydroxytetrahydrobiopterin dehydratase [Actinomycetota bacterium]